VKGKTMLTTEERIELIKRKEMYLEFFIEHKETRETQPDLWHYLVDFYEEAKLLLEQDEHQKIMSTAT
jgi:hypothetical protein